MYFCKIFIICYCVKCLKYNFVKCFQMCFVNGLKFDVMQSSSVNVIANIHVSSIKHGKANGHHLQPILLRGIDISLRQSPLTYGSLIYLYSEAISYNFTDSDLVIVYNNVVILNTSLRIARLSFLHFVIYFNFYLFTTSLQ